ncbi:MAG: pyruvate ferredoxin oxidoreductase [Clostridia bacterium]|nr:pyruvate ferredoxin oxidoreductase [Clostridia bacterium]
MSEEIKKPYNLKEIIANKPSRFTEGHRMCAGCGAPIVGRMVLRALHEDDHAVITNATGCMEVSTFIYPYTAWTDSFIHTAFECAGATCSGVEAAYKSMKRQGKLPEDKNTKFIAFGGDGGTYDIGLQSLSGALERGHDMTYVCYDNGAYMNTGIQRSSATPKFADTTTTPAGKVIPGKMQSRKDLTSIMVSHHLPYVAQSIAVGNFKDLYEKSEKAIYTEGATFLNVFTPCPRGWGYPTDQLMTINKLAIDTCYWPLYEVVNGVYHITYKPAKKLPIEEFLRPQKRFKHLFNPGNEWMIEEFQKEVDNRWNELLKLEELSQNVEI